MSVEAVGLRAVPPGLAPEVNASSSAPGNPPPAPTYASGDRVEISSVARGLMRGRQVGQPAPDVKLHLSPAELRAIMSGER